MLFPTVSFAVFFLAFAALRQLLLRRGWLARRIGPFAANDLALAAAGLVFCAPLGGFFCAFLASFAAVACVFDALIGRAFARERQEAARRGARAPFWRPQSGWARLARAAGALSRAVFALLAPLPAFRRRSIRRVRALPWADWREPSLFLAPAAPPASSLADSGAGSALSMALPLGGEPADRPAESLSFSVLRAQDRLLQARREEEPLCGSAAFWLARARRALGALARHRVASSSWLALGCAALLAPLLILKYQAFFAQSLGDALFSMGLEHAPRWLDAARSVDWRAPAGASFLTFNGLALLMRRHLPRQPEPAQEAHWSRKVAFLTFFPALLSGPLWRLEPFMREADALRDAEWAKGSAAFALGFFLKVAIAGWAGIVADAVFQAPDRYGAWGLFVGAQSYGAQLYADFAGYSLMALGVGFWMGMRLPQNFLGPYLARGPREFWRRWHVTLGAWFRDHLHIPLGGNRRGPAVLARNSLIVMLVCGLWHGAGWTYLIWGAIHGLWLALGSLWAPFSAYFSSRRPTLHRSLSRFFSWRPVRFLALPLLWLACMQTAMLAWIPFRCSDLACVGAFSRGLTDWSTPSGLGGLAVGVAFACLAAVVLEQAVKNPALALLERGLRAAGPWWAVLGALALWLAIWCSPSGLPNFIYFQF